MIDRKIIVIGIVAIIIVVLGIAASIFWTPAVPREMPDIFTIQSENGAVVLTYTGKEVLNRTALKIYVNRGAGLSDVTAQGEVKGSASWQSVSTGDIITLPPLPGGKDVLEVLVVTEPEGSGRPEEMIPRFISKSFIPTGEPAGSPSPSPTPPAASVPGQLVPDFVSENSSQYAPQIVQFNDTSGGDPSGWLWNFGDGSASSLKDPVHVYQNPGNYTVVLTVYNATADRSVIRENAAIVLERQSQTADPTRVFPITPQIEDNGNGTYTAYFGYNNENTIAVSIPPGPLNGFSPSPANRGQPTVFEPGIHTDAISMVFDGNDLTWTINNQKATASRFSPKRSEPPVADFSGYPVTGTAPLRVIFSDSSRGSPESWEWLFGDGSSSNEQDPEHTYLRPGNYTVTLTVKNLFGIHRATKTDYISIVSQPTGTGQPA